MITIPIQDAVNFIFDNIGITDRLVKVLPIDTYPNAETYVLSHLYASIQPTNNRWQMVRIDANKFYFTDGYWLWLIAFNEDYSQVSVLVVEYAWGGDVVRLDKWGDNFAVIVGTYWIWQYKNGASWQTWSDWKATYIHIFDGAGNKLAVQPVSGFSAGSTQYSPLARAIKHWDNHAGYVVVYHGCVSSNQVDRCAVRFFDEAHGVLQTYYDINYYFHPWLGSVMGHHTSDFFLVGLAPTTNWSGPPRFLRLRPDYSIQYTDLAGQNVANFPEPWQSIGKYVCFPSHTSAFNIYGGLETEFWSKAPNKLGQAVRQQEGQTPYHFLTGYNVSDNALITKTLIYGNQEIASELIEDVLPEGFVLLTGFTYWRTYKNKHCMFTMSIDQNPTVPLPGVSILANQFHPFVWHPPLSEGENLYETLKNLAIAGCCIFHFPAEGKGIFISRAYWDDEATYEIPQALFMHNWQITKREPVRVIVKAGSASGEVGESFKDLQIGSDYLPSYDPRILQAIAQTYHDFLNGNQYEISITGDFLIQYELFDQISADLEGVTYQGRILQAPQEGGNVTLSIRGREL